MQHQHLTSISDLDLDHLISCAEAADPNSSPHLEIWYLVLVRERTRRRQKQIEALQN
jgi:hypothetical protein